MKSSGPIVESATFAAKFLDKFFLGQRERPCHQLRCLGNAPDFLILQHEFLPTCRRATPLVASKAPQANCDYPPITTRFRCGEPSRRLVSVVGRHLRKLADVWCVGV